MRPCSLSKDNRLIAEIRPVEAGDVDRGILEAEVAHNVGAHFRRCRRCQCDGERPAQLLSHLAKAQIFRAKIVSPLADAVRLVDGQQRQLASGDDGEKARRAEALRRDVEESAEALAQLRHCRKLLIPALAAREHPGRNAQRAHLPHLVGHQRNQRRDDQREPAQCSRRQLVAEALARSGRHHNKRVAIGEHVVDDLALLRAKLFEPEDRSQDGIGIVHARTLTLTALEPHSTFLSLSGAFCWRKQTAPLKQKKLE